MLALQVYFDEMDEPPQEIRFNPLEGTTIDAKLWFQPSQQQLMAHHVECLSDVEADEGSNFPFVDAIKDAVDDDLDKCSRSWMYGMIYQLKIATFNK